LIIRGLLVGIVAGLLAFGFAKVFGEPWVDSGISFEQQQAAAAGEAEGPELVSRGMQSTFGLLTGVVMIGAGFGAIFSILFAFANGRMGSLGPQPTSVLIAGLSWLTVYFVPFLKYPPNPPGSSDGETIQFRTATYMLLLAISIASTLGAWWLRQRLRPQYGDWYASLMAIGAYIVVIGAFFLILPNVNETPEGFPAASLYDFRLASLGLQVVLWGAIGLLFGYIVEVTMLGGSPRLTQPEQRRSAMST